MVRRGTTPGIHQGTVSAWRVALEARGLGAVSINVRITAVRKLAVEAADNGLLAPELANGITRVKGVKSKGVRLGNWLTVRQAHVTIGHHAAHALLISGCVLLWTGKKFAELGEDYFDRLDRDRSLRV